MTQPLTATIIPFPARLPADTALERLRRALAALDAALIGQAAAVVAWRDSIAALGTSTRQLGDSLIHYRRELDDLDLKVAALHGQAVRLSGEP